eukprot:GEMP01043741.1.p1 GENE.GEMP01043741.1~~GEMP01043741.1.p1  ORF type:complete len:548 (+),score=91.66 GEMP01043741.1:129-1772(+)
MQPSISSHFGPNSLLDHLPSPRTSLPSPTVHMGIMKMGIQIPTQVQNMTIPKLLDRQSVLMVGQTGTGKTLAYVVPMIQHLLETDDKDVYPKAKKPRGLIIVPTRELAKQVLRTVRTFPVQSIAAAPGQAYALETKALFHGIDVVVGTPARLLIHAQRYNIFFSEIQSLVIDEADTLCDTFYEKDVLQIISKIKAGQRPTVCVVSATRTQAVSAFLHKHLHSKTALIHTVVTDDSHRTPDKLQEEFIPVKGQRRSVVLHDILAATPPEGDNRTLIFTNTVQSCKSVYADLLNKGMKVQSLHGEMKPTRRNQVVRDFETKDNILVATNLASRGLDFKHLDHVILYDFPFNAADYIHRVGRTARAGSEGRVTTIVRRRNYPLVEQIKQLQTSKRPISVRDVSKAVVQVMTEERLLHGLSRIKKKAINKRYWKKKFGVPPAHNLGSPERKKMRRAMHKRINAVKQLFMLRKRGRLAKDALIPTRPDSRVEGTESQTITNLVKTKEGKLQMLALRRKTPIEPDSESAEITKDKNEKLRYRTKGERGRKTFM